MDRVNEEGHRVPRDLFPRVIHALLVRDDTVRESFDESASLNFHCLTNLDYHAVFGHLHLDYFSIPSLTMKTDSWIRPIYLLTSNVGIESRC